MQEAGVLGKAASHRRAAASSPLMGRLVLLAMATLALAFVAKYVFRYYLHYDEASYTQPPAGSPNYWSGRYWLLLHITGGMVALLSGPLQFLTGLGGRSWNLHRWTGRLFLAGAAAGSAGGYYLAIHTTFGWAWGVALATLSTAWLTTSGMAWYCIVQRKVQVHKEWMVRAYIVTFGFVTFRILNDYGPTSRLEPVGDRIITYAWACWVVPLLVAEVVLELRRLRRGAA